MDARTEGPRRGEGVDIVNTYDPMDRIVYRHLDSRGTVPSHPIAGGSAVHRLPSGYANGSPRTYLGSSRRRTPLAA